MPSSKRSTSQDVADMAGVSRTTVSFVLNRIEGVSISESTRERVWEAARTLNYHPNSAGRKLVSGRSNTIGLVLCQSPEQVFADAFLPRVILGVEQAAMQQGFHVLLKPVDPSDSEGYARLIRENHVDGIILSGPRNDDAEILRLHAERVPIVLLGQLPGTDIAFVDVDAISGAENAVTHLLDAGHTCVGIITNAPLTYTSAQQRRLGYINALQNRNIDADPALTTEGNYTPASGYHAMMQLLSQSPALTAVFVASDVVAAGAILAAKRRGLRIPADLAIVGFDDIPMAEYMDPPLTTVRLPAFGLGWAAGERLVQLVRRGDLDQQALLLESQLIIRDSTLMG